MGVIGYAHPHVLNYVPIIANHPKINFIGIFGGDINVELAKSDAQKFKVKYYKDIEESLSSDETEAIYIGSETSRHLEIIKLATKYSKHILCDKPISITLKEADKIIKMTRSAKLKLMVPFNPRFMIPLIRAKKDIEGNKIGELVYIYAISEYGKIPSLIKGFNTNWLFNPQKSGGGGFADTAPHGIDSLRWLVNSEAKSVYADIGNKIFPNLEVDDIGTVIIEFKNGVIGVLGAGWANPETYPTWLDIRYEILGTKGFININKPYHDLVVYGEEKIVKEYWWRNDVRMILDEFINCIFENRDPIITGEDARASLEIILAAYKSSKKGEVINLPLTNMNYF
jgi:predicted dehydrogenase